MGKTKIVLNRAGVRELMQSPEMQAILTEHANKIASASDTEAYVAQTRAVVKVCGDDGNNGIIEGGWKAWWKKSLRIICSPVLEYRLGWKKRMILEMNMY